MHPERIKPRFSTLLAAGLACGAGINPGLGVAISGVMTPETARIATGCFPNTQFRDLDVRLGTDSTVPLLGASVIKTIGGPSIFGTRPSIKTAALSGPSVVEINDFSRVHGSGISQIARVEARSYLAIYPKNMIPGADVKPVCLPSRNPAVITRGNPRWRDTKITLTSTVPTIKCRLSDRDRYFMAGVSLSLIYVRGQPDNPFRFGFHINDAGPLTTFCRPMYSRAELQRIRDDPLTKKR